MCAASAVVLLALSGCGSSGDDIEADVKPAEAESYQVRIGFSGEITSITESPLSRADGAKDWYVFQVYSSPENEDNYTYYAYGLFDSKDDMVISLKGGYKYRFDVDMIVGASEKVRGYSLPDNVYYSNTIPNNFIISASDGISYMHLGRIKWESFEGFGAFDYSRPNVDRFFGKAVDYIPKENGTISINMKRVAFGAKFVAKDFKEGTLWISIDGASTLTLEATDGNEIQDIFSFYYLAASPGSSRKYAYENDDYTETIPVSIDWIKADGTRELVANKDIDFKRNMLTTVEFTVAESSTSSSIDLTANEEMGTGETITIENSTSTGE